MPHCRPSVALVCRAWRQAFYNEGELWRHLDLGGGDVWALLAGERRAVLAARRHLLARVAPLVATFSLHLHAWQQYGWRLLDLLQLLHPQRLAALRLDCRGCTPDAGAGAASALLRFSRLERLELEGSAAELPVGAGAALAGLRSLRSVQLSTDVVGEAAVAGILRLTSLTQLHLEASAPIPWAAQLARLSRLRRLRLHERRPSSSGPPGQPHPLAVLAAWARDGHAPAAFPPPAAFPALVSYSYARDRCWGHLELGGARLQQAELSCVNYGCGGGMEWALSVQPAGPPSRPSAAGGGGATPVPSLRDLFDALLPPGAPLHSLRLGGGGGLQARAAHDCRQLAGLQALRLDGCPPEGTEAEAGVQALLAQATALTALQIDGAAAAEAPPGQGTASMTAVPGWLAATHGLRALGITSHQLETLPGGPYLSGLTSLDLAGNQLSALPPAVAAATSLRRLGLSGNQLAALPQGPYLAALHELDVSDNPLPCLPPALTSATDLRRLLLGQPPTLADVHAVLLRLPALRELVLPQGGGAEEGALAALQAAAPCLEVFARL